MLDACPGLLYIDATSNGGATLALEVENGKGV